MTITFDAVLLPWLWTLFCGAMAVRVASDSSDWDFGSPFIALLWLAGGIPTGWAVYFGVTS